MLYYNLIFAAAFLPLVLLCYQLFPAKFRWVVLLGANIVFYSTFSIKAYAFVIFASGVIWLAALLMERMESQKSAALKSLKAPAKPADSTAAADAAPSAKAAAKDKSHALESADKGNLKEQKARIRAAFQKREKALLAAGILLLLAVLLYLKYSNFFAANINAVLDALRPGVGGRLPIRALLLPLGISFYTLQAIGYLCDVYWQKIPAQKNPFKLLLFLSFFPTIIEGPITPYAQVQESLFAGTSLDPDQVIQGYARIAWGAFKKLVIADRLYPAVMELYNMTYDPHGVAVVAAAVLFTLMEYMEFSGCIDMAIGSARVFGIVLPENFRQPFFAKNAAEFWRRWHISLGVWFKTYIFYPVSTGKLVRHWSSFSKDKMSRHLSRLGVSAIALLPVWLANGLWHGPEWKYLFFGVFYFVILMLEQGFEPVGDALLSKLHLDKDHPAVTAIRMLRTWAVIFTGELFFRADNLAAGFRMFFGMFRDFGLHRLWDGTVWTWRVDGADWIIILLGLCVVAAVSIAKERGVNVLERILQKPLPVRWAVGLIAVIVLVMFGLYGPGFTEVDLIYAGF